MKMALIVTGALTALVLLFPGVIIIGMFLLVVPGLVLMAMPTVFLYLLATWLIRMVLPVESDLVAYPLALAGALALASLAVLPLRLGAQSAFEDAIQPEVVPDAPIAVAGHVLIEEEFGYALPPVPRCDALCLALLDLEAVETVTVTRDGKSASYRLITPVPYPEMPLREAALPDDAGRIIALAGQARDYKRDQAAIDSLQREWEARLSGAERLVEVDQPEDAPDWRLSDRRGDVSTVREIVSADGDVRLRHVTVSNRIPSIPPYLAFDFGGSDSGFAFRGFRLGGSPAIKSTTSGNLLPQEAFARALALKDYWTAHAPAPDDQSQ